MWTTEIGEGDRAGVARIVVRRDSAAVSYAAVVEAWRCDAEFRAWFNALLAGAAFRAFRWETPPVTATTVGQPFEFVVLDSPSLERQPDPEAFREHFGGGPEAEVAVFANLGGDATMVVPQPLAAATAYGHLAAFVRSAPDHQRHALWRAVGDAMARRIGTKPVWLSTAGAGVSWLHVRLDDRPKYYGFAPYRALAR